MNLTNKTAFITGAANGIGKEIALKYASAGANIIIADLALESAQQCVNDIEKMGGKALAVSMDVANEQQVEAGIQQAIQQFGGIDILISNAGIQIINAIVDLSYADWKKMLAIHLDGAFLTTRACMRNMVARGKGGTILYMGSVHSHEASPLKAPYVTAKHGLLGLARVIAKEGAAHNIRANVICPGFVRTQLVEKQIPEQAKELGISEDNVVKKVMLKDTVDGEFTTTADIADVALFLAAFPTNALTGQSITVSHGWYMG